MLTPKRGADSFGSAWMGKVFISYRGEDSQTTAAIDRP